MILDICTGDFRVTRIFTLSIDPHVWKTLIQNSENNLARYQKRGAKKVEIKKITQIGDDEILIIINFSE